MSTGVAEPSAQVQNAHSLTAGSGSAVQPNIEALVAETQAGCIEAFEALVAHFHQRIYHYLYQLTGNSHDAEDLTQITFLKAFRNIHRYQSHHAFHAWLFTIAKRSALNHFRDRRPTEELDCDQAVEPDNPSGILERADDRGDLWSMARSLKPAQYEALWLRYGEGLSVAEAARVMKTNSLRVRVLLHRGRAALGRKLVHTERGREHPHPAINSPEKEEL